MAAYAFSFQDSEFIDVDIFTADMGGSIAPVIYRRRGTVVHNQGTAFCVLVTEQEAVFVTARHVIKDLPDSPDIELMLLLPSATDIRHLVGVRIEQVSLADTFSDVAMLVVKLDSPAGPIAQPQHLLISFGEPRLDDLTMAIGYQQEPDAISYHSVASRGRILTVYPSKRDTVTCDFPVFETTARYNHATSGGLS